MKKIYCLSLLAVILGLLFATQVFAGQVVKAPVELKQAAPKEEVTKPLSLEPLPTAKELKYLFCGSLKVVADKIDTENEIFTVHYMCYEGGDVVKLWTINDVNHDSVLEIDGPEDLDQAVAASSYNEGANSFAQMLQDFVYAKDNNLFVPPHCNQYEVDGRKYKAYWTMPGFGFRFEQTVGGKIIRMDIKNASGYHDYLFGLGAVGLIRGSDHYSCDSQEALITQ